MDEAPIALHGEEPEAGSLLAAARASAAFVAWRDALASFELDGERLYLPTGDVPVAEQELAENWLRGERDEPGD